MKLLIEDDEGKKTAVPFSSEEITVGRLQKENTVHLPERNVSRHHARFTVVNGGVFVEDLGSSNGTRINGERLQGRRKLRTGDLIQIGDYDLAVQDGAEEIDRSNAATVTVTAATQAATPPAPAPASAARASSAAVPAAAPPPAAPRPTGPTGVSSPTEPAFPAMAAPAPTRATDLTQSDRMTKADRLIQSDRITAPATAAARSAPEAPHRTESRPGIRPAPPAPAPVPSAGWALPISRNRLVAAAVTVFVAFAVLGFVVGRTHASPAPAHVGAPSTTR